MDLNRRSWWHAYSITACVVKVLHGRMNTDMAQKHVIRDRSGKPLFEISTSRFYASNFGMIWSFNRDGFRRLLVDGTTPDGYDMDRHGKLISTKTLEDGDFPDRMKYTHICIKPLDWEKSVFRNALAQLDKEDWDGLYFREYFR